MEAKNTGLRSILKQMTSYPVGEGEITKSKQKISAASACSKKKSRTYAEFIALSPKDESVSVPPSVEVQKNSKRQQ